MIVFDDRTFSCSGREAWARSLAWLRPLRGDPRPSHDAIIAALIETGIFEAGVADALCAARDELHPILPELRAAMESLGRAAACSWHHECERAAAHVARASARLEALEIDALPPSIPESIPEGYAYYSLYPEMYVDAAERWAREARPDRVVCIGLRSIGTSLSAAVHGALRRIAVDARSWTVRPQGHPFSRRVEIAPELRAGWDPARATFLIIDEGPGLSGSSMTGAAAALGACGVPDDHIVLFPAWNPPVDRFVSDDARARWPRHRAVVASFDPIRSALAARDLAPDGAIEISAGAWRERVFAGEPWPAVHPQHERRKYLTGDGRIARFAGLGRYGAATWTRAAELARAGWIAAPDRLENGFLVAPFVDGVPLRTSDASTALLAHIGTYAGWLRRHMSGERRAQTERLGHMLRVNVQESLGRSYLEAADVLAREAERFDEPATAVDGRLMPHEWLRARGGYTKTDALDHHRDHFCPGATDAAWDVAGAIVEWGLRDEARDVLVASYEAASRDRAIAWRLAFFAAAYAAFRTGYAVMSAQALAGTDDGARFGVMAAGYRSALERVLTSVPSGR